MTTQIPLDVLKEAAYQAGIDDGDIREFNYNGRYYANDCFGIVGGIRDFAAFVLEVERLDDGCNYANELVDTVATDNMAQSTIFYFPGIRDVESEDDDDGS